MIGGMGFLTQDKPRLLASYLEGCCCLGRLQDGPQRVPWGGPEHPSRLTLNEDGALAGPVEALYDEFFWETGFLQEQERQKPH